MPSLPLARFNFCLFLGASISVRADAPLKQLLALRAETPASRFFGLRGTAGVQIELLAEKSAAFRQTAPLAVEAWTGQGTAAWLTGGYQSVTVSGDLRIGVGGLARLITPSSR